MIIEGEGVETNHSEKIKTRTSSTCSFPNIKAREILKGMTHTK